VAALYLDNDVTVHAAPLLDKRGHIVHTTAIFNRQSSYDHEQLLFAAQGDRVLVTHNWHDFRLLHGAWQLWSRAWGVSTGHAGILVVEHGSAQQIATTIADFFAHYPVDASRNALWRHRHATGWVKQS
jgi:hypothetical protein